MVEIISPESVSRDRGAKFLEYEQGGVSEYWLIDPIHAQAEFYQRGADGYFHPIAPDAEGVYRSQVLDGFWFRLAWLWQDPQPTLRDILREWGLL